MSLALEEKRKEAEETLTLLAAAKSLKTDLNTKLLAALSEIKQVCNDMHRFSESQEESKLSKALCQRSSFISLRRAIYTHAVQMISVYRYVNQFCTRRIRGTIVVSPSF